MSYENVKQYLESVGIGDRLKLLSHASATVEQAADLLAPLLKGGRPTC